MLIVYDTDEYTEFKSLILYQGIFENSKFSREMHIAINDGGTLLAASRQHISSICIYCTEDMHLVMKCAVNYDIINWGFHGTSFHDTSSLVSLGEEIEGASYLKRKTKHRSDTLEVDEVEDSVKSSSSMKDINCEASVHIQGLSFCYSKHKIQ